MKSPLTAAHPIIASDTAGTTKMTARPSKPNDVSIEVVSTDQAIHPAKATMAAMNVGAGKVCLVLTIWTASPGAARNLDDEDSGDWE